MKTIIRILINITAIFAVATLLTYGAMNYKSTKKDYCTKTMDPLAGVSLCDLKPYKVSYEYYGWPYKYPVNSSGGNENRGNFIFFLVATTSAYVAYLAVRKYAHSRH